MTISQARLFNKECPIYLVASHKALMENAGELKANRVTGIECESLTRTLLHERFHVNESHDWSINGFWVYTSERFFYLEEFIREYNLSDVFHMENDIMLYVNLESLLPIFQKHYDGMIAATFENDERCVPGILYISNPKPMAVLVESFPKAVDITKTDMETIGRFRAQYRKVYIDDMPLIPREYAQDYQLAAISSQGYSIVSSEPESYSNHIEDFGGVFDAAAFGVYQAGMNSDYHSGENGRPGKINSWCVFNPSLFGFGWKIDEEGRRVPFITYKNAICPLFNLHLTNKKRIPLFYSMPLPVLE